MKSLTKPGRVLRTASAVLAVCAGIGAAPVSAQLMPQGYSGKLLLTGGVSQVEGAAGGGLTPWAVIGGQGTRDQIGASAFKTTLALDDYQFDAHGFAIGLYDRVELSFADQAFNTQDVGALLGLGQDFTFRQSVWGVKVKVAGDAVLGQDSWLPQIAIGAQHKQNNKTAIVKAVGARDDKGTDYYLSATKIFLDKSLLANVTLRATRANQFGLLGFGGDKSDDYELQFEGSLAYLLHRTLAIGVEYRQKPDNLGFAREQDAYDIFLAWAPTKNVSATLAYAHLGDIATIKKQKGLYASLQLAF